MELIIFIIKTSALLSSIAIDISLLSGLLGRSIDFNQNGRIIGFITLFLISSLVYLALL